MAGSPLWQATAVGAGGFVGSLLRYLLSGLVYRIVPFATMPWGTLAVNVAGCLAIGSIAGISEARAVLSPTMRLFLLVGVLGGFTTYSTFAYETVTLLGNQDRLGALLYVVYHLSLGIGAAWLGYSLGRAL